MKNKKSIIIIIIIIILGVTFTINKQKKINELNKNTPESEKMGQNLFFEKKFNLIHSWSLKDLNFETFSLWENCWCYESACKIIIKKWENIIDEINSKKIWPCDVLAPWIPVLWFDDENIITKETFWDSSTSWDIYYKYNINKKEKTLIYSLNSNYFSEIPEQTIIFWKNKYLIIEWEYLEIYKIKLLDEELKYNEKTYNTLFDEDKMILISKNEIKKENFEIVWDYKWIKFKNWWINYSIIDNNIFK